MYSCTSKASKPQRTAHDLLLQLVGRSDADVLQHRPLADAAAAAAATLSSDASSSLLEAGGGVSRSDGFGVGVGSGGGGGGASDLRLLASSRLMASMYSTLACRNTHIVSIRQHTSAYVSIRQHTSAYRYSALACRNVESLTGP
jgi:hypothetical protein